MKAWIVRFEGYPEVVAYGETRGKMLYALWLRGAEMSYSFKTFMQHTKCKRASEHDCKNGGAW